MPARACGFESRPGHLIDHVNNLKLQHLVELSKLGVVFDGTTIPSEEDEPEEEVAHEL